MGLAVDMVGCVNLGCFDAGVSEVVVVLSEVVVVVVVVEGLRFLWAMHCRLVCS